MSESKAPDVRVENQLVRFSHEQPVDQEMAIQKLSGKRSGNYVLIQLSVPRATIVVDAEGRIVFMEQRGFKLHVLQQRKYFFRWVVVMLD